MCIKNIISLVLFYVLSANLAGISGAVEYPDVTKPSLACIEKSKDNLKLYNNVISCRLVVKDTRMAGVSVKLLTGISKGGVVFLQEPFSLKINGKAVKVSELKLEKSLRVEKVKAAPGAYNLAKRYGGWKIGADYKSKDGTYQLRWYALLRDGSNYIKYGISVSVLRGELSLSHIELKWTTAGPARVVGKDDGSPVVSGGCFLALEHPMALYSIRGNKVHGYIDRANTILKTGKTVTYSAVVGVVPEGQLRRGFLYYFERERPRPYHQFLHYNSWYDIAHSARKKLFDEPEVLKRVEQYGKELVKKRGVKLDGFVMDDPWDNPDSVWQFDPKRFPDKWQKFKLAAEHWHAATGVWMSPFGGYGNFKARRINAARKGKIKYETHHGGFMLSGDLYNAKFRSVAFDFIHNQGVRYFKFDGIGGGLYQKGPVGWARADYEALFDLIADLRSEQPDIFINATVGSWHSPYYLMYADSIWRDGGDFGRAGQGSVRRKTITYRDKEIYKNVVKENPLFPLPNLMAHGVILATYAPAGMRNTPDTEQFKEDVRDYFAMGYNLQELYIGPDNPDNHKPLMTSKLWDIVAEAAKWSRKNEKLFADAHWVGGNPAAGEIYGAASWNDNKAILMLRNPAERPQSISIDVQKVFELPTGAKTIYIMKSPWADESSKAAVRLEAGKKHVFKLAGFEVKVLAGR